MDNEGLEAIRYLGAGVFGGLGACYVLYNVYSVLRNCLPHERWISPVPLIGGMFCTLAFVLVPSSEIRRFWWLAFVLDYTWPMFIWYLAFYSWKSYPCSQEVGSSGDHDGGLGKP